MSSNKGDPRNRSDVGQSNNPPQAGGGQSPNAQTKPKVQRKSTKSNASGANQKEEEFTSSRNSSNINSGRGRSGNSLTLKFVPN